MKFSTKTKAIWNSMEFSHGIRRALMGALMLVYLVSLGFDIIAITTLFAVSTLILTLFEFPLEWTISKTSFLEFPLNRCHL